MSFVSSLFVFLQIATSDLASGYLTFSLNNDTTVIPKQCQPKLGIAFPFIRCKVGSPSRTLGSLVFVFAIPSDPWRPVPPGASHARFPRNLLGGYEVPLHNESQKSKTLEANYIFSDVTFRTIIQTYRILKIEGEGFGCVQ